MHIIQLSKEEVTQLLAELQAAKEYGRAGLYSLRVAPEGDSVKFKINSGMWTHAMGQLDPQSDEAYRRREMAK